MLASTSPQAKKTKKAKKTGEEAESALEDAASKIANAKGGDRMKQPPGMIGGTMKNYQVSDMAETKVTVCGLSRAMLCRRTV